MSLNSIAQMLSLNLRTVKKYSDPAYEPSPPKRQRPHLIDRFMPHVREYVRNRLTLQETDAHLRQLGYRGSFGAVRHRLRDAEHLLSLITNPQVISHPRLKRFVGRLKQNIEVILAACLFEESNGYVEGNFNRLKMLKRFMYGRRNFDLLRIQVLCRNPEPSRAH